MRRLLAALLVAVALPAPGQAPAPPAPVELEAGASHERLTGGRADWRSVFLEGVRPLGDRRVAYGGLRETSRFGLEDRELWAGYSQPLGTHWTGTLEASASGEHRVLPRYSAFGQVARRLPDGWGLSAGWRHSEFTRSGVDLLVLGAERYAGSFRGAYTLYRGRPEGGSAGISHRFAFNYYYGERSTVGLALSRGREVENLGPPAGILATSVRNLTLAGRHELTPAWILSWELGAQEQGTLYRREGFRLGLRRRF